MRSVASRARALVLVPLLAACAGAPKAASVSTTGHGSAAPRQELPSLDDRAILEAMRGAAVPGLAVAYLRDCRVERVATYGVVDADSLAPVTPATLFEAASLSKPVFAYLVMQLVDSGRIDLDAPIARTLEYPRIRDRERYAAVTPRLALSHSTGLPNWSGRPRDWERTDSLTFAFAPGAAFRYSGEGYQWTQVYAELLTGRSLQELFRASLGEVMPASVFGGPLPAGAMPAFGHDTAGSRAGGRAIGQWDRGNAAFTLRTTVEDYARFVARVCDGAGLSRAVHAEMLRPRVRLVGDEQGADPARIEAELGWALGWGTQTTGDRTIHFHWGDNGPFKAFTAFDTASRRGLVYFANAARGLELMEALAAPVVGSVRPIAVWLD